MKYLLMLDTPFWLCVTAVMTVWNVKLRNRIKGLNDPRLYLSKGERRAWARQQLEQERQDRDNAQIEQLNNIIKFTKGDVQ